MKIATANQRPVENRRSRVIILISCMWGDLCGSSRKAGVIVESFATLAHISQSHGIGIFRAFDGTETATSFVCRDASFAATYACSGFAACATACQQTAAPFLAHLHGTFPWTSHKNGFATC